MVSGPVDALVLELRARERPSCRYPDAPAPQAEKENGRSQPTPENRGRLSLVSAVRGGTRSRVPESLAQRPTEPAADRPLYRVTPDRVDLRDRLAEWPGTEACASSGRASAPASPRVHPLRLPHGLRPAGSFHVARPPTRLRVLADREAGPHIARWRRRSEIAVPGRHVQRALDRQSSWT